MRWVQLGCKRGHLIDLRKDAKVFDICHDIILNIVETLKQESLTIANELKNLNKINIEEVAANFEEIEFLANCKRILNNAIKNRNNQNSLTEFEMMKLVRYQDSRIVKICKEQFVFLQESANVEIDLLDMCKKVFQEFIQMVTATIQLTESVLLSVVEKKLKIEIEVSDSIIGCEKFFSEIAEVLKADILGLKEGLKDIQQNRDEFLKMNDITLNVWINNYEDFITSILQSYCEDGKELKNKVEFFEENATRKLSTNCQWMLLKFLTMKELLRSYRRRAFKHFSISEKLHNQCKDRKLQKALYKQWMKAPEKL
ncbi:uncharacterized protein CEXT_701 [Caerostris extrusa]|uniref:Uncharacterized protein n=1 Tax=Caerostris extrusa TaxID=172846 RepID=A0AAV4RWK0_CAEEX|nr:uncharacterized protein CEXT_701 [Caerostris extrusa]